MFCSLIFLIVKSTSRQSLYGACFTLKKKLLLVQSVRKEVLVYVCHLKKLTTNIKESVAHSCYFHGGRSKAPQRTLQAVDTFAIKGRRKKQTQTQFDTMN